MICIVGDERRALKANVTHPKVTVEKLSEEMESILSAKGVWQCHEIVPDENVGDPPAEKVGEQVIVPDANVGYPPAEKVCEQVIVPHENVGDPPAEKVGEQVKDSHQKGGEESEEEKQSDDESEDDFDDDPLIAFPGYVNVSLVNLINILKIGSIVIIIITYLFLKWNLLQNKEDRMKLPAEIAVKNVGPGATEIPKHSCHIVKFVKNAILQAYDETQIARMVHGERGHHCGKILDYNPNSPNPFIA